MAAVGRVFDPGIEPGIAAGQSYHPLHETKSQPPEIFDPGIEPGIAAGQTYFPMHDSSSPAAKRSSECE